MQKTPLPPFVVVCAMFYLLISFRSFGIVDESSILTMVCFHDLVKEFQFGVIHCQMCMVVVMVFAIEQVSCVPEKKHDGVATAMRVSFDDIGCYEESKGCV